VRKPRRNLLLENDKRVCGVMSRNPGKEQVAGGRGKRARAPIVLERKLRSTSRKNPEGMGRRWEEGKLQITDLTSPTTCHQLILRGQNC
jgi:hypothetical protein